MCGICAGISNADQMQDVIGGLEKLEYRGYDSCGVAFLKKDKIQVVKSVGRIESLRNKVENISANIVIGHTRWATHGKVSEENSHPHLSFDGRFAIVHNGIIENYEEIKNKYLKNIKLLSETDTEVFVNLIAIQSGTTLEKIKQACEIVKGSFAIALLEISNKKIYAAKRCSSLMIGQNKEGCFCASDVSVFAKKLENCFVLEDDEFAELNSKNIKIFDKNGKKIEKKCVFLKNYDFFEEKLEEKFFMIKEIKEQSQVLKRTYLKYFAENFFNKNLIKEINKFNSFHFIACGTAYHSSLLGARYIKKFCHKNCDVSIASEFRYDDNILKKDCLFVFVSQSGETADTIACAKMIKEAGHKILCVTNVPYCSLNKLADFVLPTFAGKEVAVASTKAYTAQCFTILILSLLSSGGKIDLEKFVSEFSIFKFDEKLFNEIFKYKKIFFIGRQQDYITSLEASLKLKEIAYVNCSAWPAGELKHGSLALVDESTLVIATSTVESLKEKVESNLLEVQSRGGKVLLLTNLDHSIKTDYLFRLPNFEEVLMPIVSIVPLQFLAFEYSKKLGLNPDKPRNLAKSVTVE